MADKPYFLHLKREINLGEDLEFNIPLSLNGVLLDDNFESIQLEIIKKKEKNQKEIKKIIRIIKVGDNFQVQVNFLKVLFDSVSTSLNNGISDLRIDKGSLQIKFYKAKEEGNYTLKGNVNFDKNLHLKAEIVEAEAQLAEVVELEAVVAEANKEVLICNLDPVDFVVGSEVSHIVPNLSGVQKVSLVESGRENTEDQLVWTYIRNGVLDFNEYKTYLDEIFGNTREGKSVTNNNSLTRLPLNQTDAYMVMKFATDFYIKKYFQLDSTERDFYDNTKINDFERESRKSNIDAGFLQSNTNSENYWLNGQDYLPYFKSILKRLSPFKKHKTPFSSLGNFNISKLQDINLLELIWSYWHEEGGLVQTMNALSLRFQNVRTGGNDPLAGLNIDPLRPINNLVWGYIEDERNRLSIARRNLEYQYEYGISLIGRAVPVVQVAESRSQFLPAFHNLLKTSIDFYQQANYTTVIPDGFPVLNSLREVHMLLAEGAHNQFGSLPWTARSEMMMQQWLLARPEMREFLGGRIMVPYQEPWMDRVDTMKTIQGWNPTNVSHFHDLGAFGEQLLLSIRYGDWNNSTKTRDEAANWAYYWREEIQRYVHAYKAATGVDLGNDVTDARIAMPQNVERYTQPSVLIGRRVNSLPNNRPSQLNRLTQRRNIERY